MLPPESQDQIHINIGGSVQAEMAAFGKNITEHQAIAQIHQTQITQADWQALRQVLIELRTQVAAEVPAPLQMAALQQVHSLSKAITAQKPDINAITKVQQWFSQYFPKLTGAVTSVVIHPVVGKIVEAAGEMLATDFRRRFEQN